MQEHDLPLGHADKFGVVDVLPVLCRHGLRPDQAGDLHPAEAADDNDDGGKALFKQQAHNGDHDDPGHGAEHIDEAHEDAVDDATEVARHHAHHHADGDGGDHGQHAHQQGYPRTVDDTGQIVTAQLVGAEEVFLIGGRQHFLQVHGVGVQVGEFHAHSDNNQKQQKGHGKPHALVADEFLFNKFQSSVFHILPPCPDAGIDGGAEDVGDQVAQNDQRAGKHQHRHDHGVI